MDEPPKKKRRMLIIDVESDGTPINPLKGPPAITITSAGGPGHIHGQAQQEVLRLCREANFDEEKIEDRVWIKLDEILKATTIEEARAVAKVVLDSAAIYFMLNTKVPEKQAKAAERLAKMHRNKGEDDKADQQEAKARQIRAGMDAKR